MNLTNGLMMSITQLTDILLLIAMIGGIPATIFFWIRKLIKSETQSINDSLISMNQRLEHISDKMASRKTMQTILALHTREIVGFKTRFNAILKAMEAYLTKHGVVINRNKESHVNDLSHLYEVEEGVFIHEITNLIKKAD
jgi:uncharacterized protein YyaL (SSP411 family)